MSAFGDPIAENTPEDKKHADWLEAIASPNTGNWTLQLNTRRWLWAAYSEVG